jgi:CRISPR-associated endonuclease Csn1
VISFQRKTNKITAMSKFILGLDVGTNSIGWTLFKNNTIIDGGIVIFPIGTNVNEKGIEKTKNSVRGLDRRASRNHYRYKIRRKDLKKLLDQLNILPDFHKNHKAKDLYQAKELYALRAMAIDGQVPADEIGRLFLLLNKHRGFKSNSKLLSETKDDEGVVKEGIGQLQNFMNEVNARTVGEYFHKMYEKASALYKQGRWHNINEPYDERAVGEDGKFGQHNNRGIRREHGRYVARSMYEKEFDLIWETQKKYYPQLTGGPKEYEKITKLPVAEKRLELKRFKQTAYWKVKHQTIFYQRPLKSQKKFIGKCPFELNKRTAPVSSLLFQEFRIWKQLADIRFTDKENDIVKQPLSEHWKQKVFEYLEINLKLNLREGGKKKDSTRNTDIMDVLGITNKKNFEFNLDNADDDKSFEGNKTLYAIATACGIESFNQLKEDGKLEKIWHILYMAKDDEWLKDTLTEKWKFTPEVATKLIEMGLEEGFANYSSKVLKKLLPYLRVGEDEYDALLLSGCLKVTDEKKDTLPNKITQLTNNELRNPVVEKAVAETIKLVNALLKSEHQIDQNDFTIRLESTRDLKKPKKERENIRRGNSDIDKRREEYARFLNEKRERGELQFSRNIQKYDSIIHKFELWLELGADKHDPSFKDFEKIVERKDREKHSLWLECNRICPYTGKVISLSQLFSSEIEIEHIIPYSRSLDDSFMNKTVTFYNINKEKGDQTAFEYLSGKGKAEFKSYSDRLKVFSKDKREKHFLKGNVEKTFTNAQISNTSFIAKYVRKKLQEVCKDVQFTNGAATAELRKNDWRLGNLLDKIRYEELTGIDIDTYLRDFSSYKRDFEAWRRKMSNSSDVTKINWRQLTADDFLLYEAQTKNPIFEWWQEIQKFDAFRSSNGKKDRSDHRHHLLDAIVIAMCSPKIIQELSTLNQLREKQGIYMYDENGELTREKIDCPLRYDQIKAAVKDVLVYHKAEQKLMTIETNRIRKRKHHEEDSIVIKQKVLVPRGSLHKDTFFGKLKDPSQQGFDKKDVYVSRVEINAENFKGGKDETDVLKGLEKVIDKNVRIILKNRLLKYGGKGEKAFSEEALLNDPLYLYSTAKYPNGAPENPVSKDGKPLPVLKKVRVANKNSRNLIQLIAKDEQKNIVNANRYAEADGNYVMALYESKETDKKGKVKIKRDFEIVSFFKAVERRSNGEKLFPDEKLQKDGTYLPLMSSCPFLKQGDFVVLFETNEKEIDWENKNGLKKRLFKVTELGLNPTGDGYAVIKLVKHNLVKTSKDSYSKEGPFLKKSESINAVKVLINNLGKIEKYSKCSRTVSIL